MSVIALLAVYAYFSDESNIRYDMTGIVHDIKATNNGYTFSIDTVDGDVRCYFSERPRDLGHYSLRGSFSNDHSIFFVERMMDIDIYWKND